MAATTRVDLTNVRVIDLEASKRAVDAVSDPKAKFQILDELTDKELTPSVVFSVVIHTGSDPDLAKFAHESFFPTFGNMNTTYVNRILDTVEKSKELSEYVMSSIGAGGKSQLFSVCMQVDTYIHSKLFQALFKIVNAPNYTCYIGNRNHPLNAINQKFWELQKYNHGDFCPCFKHIEAHLATKDQNPPAQTTSSTGQKVVEPTNTSSNAPKTQEEFDTLVNNIETMLYIGELPNTRITVKYDAGMGNKLYILGQGGGLGNWDKSFELKNIDADTWVYETQSAFVNLEYKIRLNDNRWETGENHKIGRGKKEEIRPKF